MSSFQKFVSILVAIASFLGVIFWFQRSKQMPMFDLYDQYPDFDVGEKPLSRHDNEATASETQMDGFYNDSQGQGPAPFPSDSENSAI